MDFTAALNYPFKSIPKVLTIVLVSTIALAAFLAMVLNSFDWIAYLQAMEIYLTYEYMPALDAPSGMLIPGVIGLIVVLIAQGFWLAGYGVSVIRHIFEGFQQLPTVQFGTNLKDGFYLFLSSIWYGLIATVIAFGLFFAIGMVSVISEALGGLLFLGSLIVGIPAFFILGWAYFVGLSRYAADNDSQVLFQIPTNFRIAKQNWKLSLSLTGHQILLAILFGFVSQAVQTGLQFIAYPVVGNDFGSGTLLTVVVLFFMVSFTVNIVQQFSSLHLIAQYATELDFGFGFDDSEF